MNTAQDFTKFIGQLPLDGTAANDAMKMWATLGKRLSGIALEVATHSTEIATALAKEIFARVGDMTKQREEPSEYAQAAAGYFQAQFELSQRTAEADAGVMQKAQAETAELVGTTGQRAAEKSAAGAESKATTTAAKTKRASKAAR